MQVLLKWISLCFNFLLLCGRVLWKKGSRSPLFIPAIKVHLGWSTRKTLCYHSGFLKCNFKTICIFAFAIYRTCLHNSSHYKTYSYYIFNDQSVPDRSLQLSSCCCPCTTHALAWSLFLISGQEAHNFGRQFWQTKKIAISKCNHLENSINLLLLLPPHINLFAPDPHS